MRSPWKSYDDYLASTEWATIREKVHNRDNKTCQLCAKKKSKGQPKWACHHWRYPVDWRIDSAENVVLLCGACHEQTHLNQTKDYATWALFLVDHFENRIAYHEEQTLVPLAMVCVHNNLAVTPINKACLYWNIGDCKIGIDGEDLLGLMVEYEDQLLECVPCTK